MGELYRVTVERVGATMDDTLFELTASAGTIGRTVPGLIADLCDLANVPTPAPAVPVMAQPAPTGNQPEAPRRTRRTKAQIAADEAAAAEAARLAAGGQPMPQPPAQAAPGTNEGPGGPDPVEAQPANPGAPTWNPFNG